MFTLIQQQVNYLHSYNNRSNVYTHTATGELFTLIQQQVKCLHSCNNRSNVYTHTATGELFTLIQQQVNYYHSYNNRWIIHTPTTTGELFTLLQQVRCLHSCYDRSNDYTQWHTMTSINSNTKLMELYTIALCQINYFFYLLVTDV